MAKYRLLRERAVATGILSEDQLSVPPPATDEDLLRVHEPGYVERVVEGRLTAAEVRRLGFPWSPQLVERSRRSVGGTLAAARTALAEGCAANLAGGTHHAFADRGEGFCVFNDAAVAARALQADTRADTRVERVLILDCDVHQGNGTASIFEDDPTVFTFSLHGRRNFPFHKEKSDLDVELEDGTGDVPYLELLESALERTLAVFPADLVIYLAGADPYHGDRFGRLALSREGLRRRDGMVFEACFDQDLPVAVVMAGGYAREVEAIIDIHAATLEEAAALLERKAGPAVASSAGPRPQPVTEVPR